MEGKKGKKKTLMVIISCHLEFLVASDRRKLKLA